MSLTDSSARLSMGPLSVLSTLPVGLGACERIPLGPWVAGSPPTRKGSWSIDSARPSTNVVQPATSSTAAAPTSADLRAWLFMTNLIPTGCRAASSLSSISPPILTRYAWCPEVCPSPYAAPGGGKGIQGISHQAIGGGGSVVGSPRCCGQ